MMSRIEQYEELSKKFSLIPLNGKIPAVGKGWEKWCVQKREFNPRDFINKNAGIACGPASGVIVLDIDIASRFKELRQENEWDVPDTFTVQSQPTKFHLYFQYPHSGHVYGCRSWKETINGEDHSVFDVRGVGGQVVAPGSIHPDTHKPYCIFKDIPIAECPDWLENYCRNGPVCIQEDRTERISGWTGRIDDLVVSPETKRLIHIGEDKGGRSNAMMTVLNALAYNELSNSEIISIFSRYAIGDKYREKGRNRDNWLIKQIDNARNFVGNETVSSMAHEDQWVEKRDFGNKIQQKVTTGNNDLQREQVGNKGVTTWKQASEIGNNGNNEDEPWSTKGLATLIGNYMHEFTGCFSSRDIDEYVRIQWGGDKFPRQYQIAKAKILTRHYEAGRLERTARGGYRIVKIELEDLDFLNASTESHPIVLPLGLSDTFTVHPKEIILVCGNSNSGKTAFTLAVAEKNTNYIHNKYINKELSGPTNSHLYHFVSEMGPSEFRTRLSEFGDGFPAFYHKYARTLVYKAESIQDQINPNAINIIDYLEPPLGEYKYVVPTINAIFQKLDKGVAVVCVQKHGDADPRGGKGVFEKPRLIVTLTNDKARGCKVAIIEKGKYAKDKRDKDGMEADYRLIRGATDMELLTDWEYPANRKNKKIYTYL